jgi:hypothetical protein
MLRFFTKVMRETIEKHYWQSIARVFINIDFKSNIPIVAPAKTITF